MNNSSPQDPSLDELLKQVKSNYQHHKSQPQSSEKAKPLVNHQKTDDIFAQIKSELQTKKQKTIEKDLTEESKAQVRQKLSSQRSDSLLDEFKNQYHNQKQSQAHNLQQNQEEIRYAEQRRQQQQKLLTRKAQQWLKELDITSDEGFWFEEFSASYSSKLEAAIDYIAALENPS